MQDLIPVLEKNDLSDLNLKIHFTIRSSKTCAECLNILCNSVLPGLSQLPVNNNRSGGVYRGAVLLSIKMLSETAFLLSDRESVMPPAHSFTLYQWIDYAYWTGAVFAYIIWEEYDKEHRQEEAKKWEHWEI